MRILIELDDAEYESLTREDRKYAGAPYGGSRFVDTRAFLRTLHDLASECPGVPVIFEGAFIAGLEEVVKTGDPYRWGLSLIGSLRDFKRRP